MFQRMMNNEKMVENGQSKSKVKKWMNSMIQMKCQAFEQNICVTTTQLIVFVRKTKALVF